jgi:transcriptional regulator with XRE-family HTH domain
VSASRDIIGKYERNDNSPSIEMALKLANVFDVSVDFLIGEGQHASYDKATIKRLEDIENLDSETKKTIFQVIDTFLRDSKTRVAYS